MELTSNLELITLSDSSTYLIQLLFVVKGNSTDTRSSWFPKRCCFGASPSVITKCSTHHRPPTKSVTTRLFVCVCTFVTSVCAYLRVGGEQLGVCVCALSENGCLVLLVMMEVLVLLVSVWFQLSTKLRVFPPTSAEQTCGHDKMSYFLSEEACFKRNHFVAATLKFRDRSARLLF